MSVLLNRISILTKSLLIVKKTHQLGKALRSFDYSIRKQINKQFFSIFFFSFPMEEIMSKQSLNTVLKTNTKKENKNKSWSFSSMWHDHLIIQRGKWRLPVKTNYGFFSVEISYFGSRYRTVQSFCHFLVFTKQLSKNLNVFFWNLQQMTEVTRCSCWHHNFIPKGLSAPAPGGGCRHV